jgi:hypothetical protein
MLEPPPRDVTLVLCTADGTVLGALPPFPVDVPWWQEVGPVVVGARRHHGLEVTVLRLLAAEPMERCAGGRVTYLAEVDAAPLTALAPWGAPMPDHPLRASWARPGGPTEDVAWADSALARLGRHRSGPAEQVRSWNLSSLWRLPTAEGAAWLKVVPPFFAHEGRAIAALGSSALPPLLATEGPRVLLDEVPGDDQYGATGAVLPIMVELLVALQAQCAGRTDDLMAIGLPDWRCEHLTDLLASAVAGRAAELDQHARSVLDGVVADLPRRWAAVEACGIPDALVHGDFHRGNLRGSADRMVLLDWGDCGIGHPLLDQAAFLTGLPPADDAAVRSAWAMAWERAVPGSDPTRAARLLEPIAALRQAVIYEMFLAGIEPDERIYHARDPVIWLERAAVLVSPGG